MAEVSALKAHDEHERKMLRNILARGEEKWNECPCGWFFNGSSTRCPDKNCKAWKKENGTKRFKLYAHADRETSYMIGRDKVGLEGDALRTFSHWGEEIEFEVEIDIETGETKLLTVDGHKIFPVKG